MSALSYHDILSKLISFPSISSASNLDLIAWMEDYLAPFNCYVERVPHPSEPKASLLVRIGPQGDEGFIFSGHTDVVPVDGQPWDTNPFELVQKGDKYYGRGSCDMKGFLACVLANAESWSQLSLKKPIYFAFSYDEEVGCDKAPAIIERIKAQGCTKAWVIIGEPTSLAPVVGQKGIVNVRTKVKGKAAHSSQILKQGISAVHEGCKFVTYLEKTMHDLIAAGLVDNDYDIPYSSLHAGVIHGGIAENVIAQNCTIDWEIRNLPSQKIEDLFARAKAYQAQLCAATPGLEFSNEFTTPIVPGLEDSDNQAFLDLVCKHLEHTEKTYVAYASEAGHFQAAGYPTLLLGPGSITQAHQANEWVELTQLARCNELLNALVAAHCA